MTVPSVGNRKVNEKEKTTELNQESVIKKSALCEVTFSFLHFRVLDSKIWNLKST